MRLTRAQAAAQMAVEPGGEDGRDEVNGRDNAINAINSNDSDINDKDSTTPKDDRWTTDERAALGELTNAVDVHVGGHSMESAGCGELKAEGATEKNKAEEREDEAKELADPAIAPQRTPAKNTIKNEFAHMRSTSNKENMMPNPPAVVASAVDRLQTRVEGGEASREGTEQQVVDDASQAGQGQDDRLIGHVETLPISPKKAEPSKETEAPEAGERAATNRLVQDRQTPSTQPSQPDANEHARKPSVRQSSVVRKSMATRPEPAPNAAIKRATSTKRASARLSMAPRPGSSQAAERGPANIPHSKPRPMSMSFPTPPPPPKSTKPPTQPTFQLGGEAVAARLKAEKEERQKRQAEQGATNPTYKAPPPPKSTKAPTRPTFQLPGEAIAAKLKAEKEERLKRQEENGASKSTYRPPAAPKSTKPPTKATFQLSSDVLTAKLKAQKEERLKREAEENEKAKQNKHVFKARPAPKMNESSAPIVRQTAASRARLPGQEPISSKPSKRYSIATSTAAAATVPVPPRPSTSLHKRLSTIPFVSKGKQVFARAAAAQEAEQKAKKEKEDAAKKARVEAAEKGRLASREWAAKNAKAKGKATAAVAS